MCDKYFTSPSSYPISCLHASNKLHWGWGKRIKQSFRPVWAKEWDFKTSKKVHRGAHLQSSTQLGGRGRKIRSPRLPSVTPSLRSVYACKHTYSGVLTCNKGTDIDTTGAHICIPFMHLKRSWKRNVQKRVSMKVLTTPHQRKPPRRLQFISFQYFP